ncbi:hypothetical protein ACI2L1_24915 [Streptomyces sp. NPDC019531]|uniref:hypothetical protein n=1 Tax=Streptomyces sp. NPDC019531 TaxID=3365062 RepID=UPI00384BFD07
MPFLAGRRSVACRDTVLEAAMVLGLELDRREDAEREEIPELRDLLRELTARLAEREEALARLEITREMMAPPGRGRRSGCGWCRRARPTKK